MFTTDLPCTAVNSNKNLYIYTIYLYVFITVQTAPQLNRLSRTVQTPVTIRSRTYIYAYYCEIGVRYCKLKKTNNIHIKDYNL